jgi:hypothetical protein
MIILLLHKLLVAAPAWIIPMISIAVGDAHGAAGDAHAAEHGDEHGGHGGTAHLPNLVHMIFGADSFAGHSVNVMFALLVACSCASSPGWAIAIAK